ncbi:MAG TPA: carboxymuconolactone decarboxylase family protein [Steroidobacteraceae bacterium]|jgi:AhpD family alkylhydroperoxidase|nr:carboxymuconolactone decarboxylase family protein [Steroidobacteraceae bacterium]
MPPKIDYYREAPRGLAALRQLEEYLHDSGLPARLLHLIKTRASQINGCAYCLDMHTKDARAVGESEQRLYTLPAWRETPFFNDRERAALAYTEALTLVAEHPDTDARIEELRQYFSDKEIVDLTLAIVAINAWNRLAISFHASVGSYQPRVESKTTPS